MSQRPITIVIPSEEKNIFPLAPITIVLQTNQITIEANIPMNFVPFSFKCTTQGQTVFGPLPFTPQAIWLYVTGSAQNQGAGDFTIDGLYITLSQGCNVANGNVPADTIYGVIQL